MAGYLAENILSGQLDVFTAKELDEIDLKEQVILDVRTNSEFEQGYIEGSVNIPVDELRDRLRELDKNKNIYTYCAVGIRGYIAFRILKQNGYLVKNLTGGYRTYRMYKS